MNKLCTFDEWLLNKSETSHHDHPEINHNWEVTKIYKDIIVTRYSFVGDPTKPNQTIEKGKFLFAWLNDPAESKNRNNREFAEEYIKNGATRYILHIKYGEQVSEDAVVFLPKDVVEYHKI